jgi:DedD protein
MTEVTQDKALQKKLVGAAVLIALAVIFLPMLFDGKKNDEPVSVQLKIPPKPVYDIPNRLDRQPVETVTVGEATEPLKTIDLSPPPRSRNRRLKSKLRQRRKL